jgi:hypothetical protein
MGEMAAAIVRLEVPPQLAVLDGINAACGMHSWAVKEPESVGLYRAIFVHPLTKIGAAVLSPPTAAPGQPAGPETRSDTCKAGPTNRSPSDARRARWRITRVASDTSGALRNDKDRRAVQGVGSPVLEADSAPTTHSHPVTDGNLLKRQQVLFLRGVENGPGGDRRWSPLYRSMLVREIWELGFQRRLDHQRAIQVRLLGCIPDSHGSEQDDTFTSSPKQPCVARRAGTVASRPRDADVDT